MSKPAPVAAETLAKLRQITSPTICNAIEPFKLRDNSLGFMGPEIRCILPQLGTMVGNAIEVKRDRDSGRIVDALRTIAYDYRTNKVSTDTMVLNGAFLVYKDRVAEFDAAVQRLDEQYGERMKFKYVGCLPPFNFVEIIIHWEEAEDESRR